MGCPVCSSSGCNRVFVEDSLSCCRCSRCYHVYQDPPEIKVFYDSQYVADRYDRYASASAMSYLRTGFVKSFSSNGTLLDVGYGNGDFIKAAMKAGFDAFGSDVHGLGEKYGVREVPLANTKNWGVVTFFDSLEHFADFSVVRGLCERATLVVVSVPQMPVWWPSARIREWRHYRPGEHLHYFTLESLQALFSRKVLLAASDVEDTVRGKLPGGEQNILTAVFA